MGGENKKWQRKTETENGNFESLSLGLRVLPVMVCVCCGGVCCCMFGVQNSENASVFYFNMNYSLQTVLLV